MEIYDYATLGGKNLILAYVNKLSTEEQLLIYDIREEIRRNGIDAFLKLRTRQLQGKLWEIKISKIRIMYVIIDEQGGAFLHICRKQKGKAEKKEINTAIVRAKSEGLM